MSAHIFIAEDDPHISLGLTELLTREGFRVSTADHGNDVEQRVANERPSLLILDIMLPGSNGFEICKSIRETQSQLPILMLSAKGQEADKVQGLTVGADDYMTKPFGVLEIGGTGPCPAPPPQQGRGRARIRFPSMERPHHRRQTIPSDNRQRIA